MTTFQRHPGTTKKGPGKKTMSRIRRAFDAEALIRVCEAEYEYFDKYAVRTNLMPSKGRERFFYHADNDSPILAVAHLDNVQRDRTCSVVGSNAGLLAVSGALDDRLGAYVILELLPKLGITFDWLLTTDEELGASTADCFEPDKQYNWVIEFDRGGTDVVMYDYETKELVELVKDSGARVGMGSFSDICMLEHLGCAAFNWGVGYQDYHSPRSHAWLEDTFRMVAYFMRFHASNADVFLPHEPFRDDRWWDDDDDEELNDWKRAGYSDDLYDWLRSRHEEAS